MTMTEVQMFVLAAPQTLAAAVTEGMSQQQIRAFTCAVIAQITDDNRRQVWRAAMDAATHMGYLVSHVRKVLAYSALQRVAAAAGQPRDTTMRPSTDAADQSALLCRLCTYVPPRVRQATISDEHPPELPSTLVYVPEVTLQRCTVLTLPPYANLETLTIVRCGVPSGELCVTALAALSTLNVGFCSDLTRLTGTLSATVMTLAVTGNRDLRTLPNNTGMLPLLRVFVVRDCVRLSRLPDGPYARVVVVQLDGSKRLLHVPDSLLTRADIMISLDGTALSEQFAHETRSAVIARRRRVWRHSLTAAICAAPQTLPVHLWQYIGTLLLAVTPLPSPDQTYEQPPEMPLAVFRDGDTEIPESDEWIVANDDTLAALALCIRDRCKREGSRERVLATVYNVITRVAEMDPLPEHLVRAMCTLDTIKTMVVARGFWSPARLPVLQHMVEQMEDDLAQQIEV
jgi:hypothetical protein